MINPNNINNLSEEEQLEHIKYFPYYIEFIKNPSDNLKLAAVNVCSHGYVIKYIKNPSEELQLAAVNNFHYEGSDEENYDLFVKQYITSKQASDLYYKLKKVNKIIK
jgi:hypothetical protein